MKLPAWNRGPAVGLLGGTPVDAEIRRLLSVEMCFTDGSVGVMGSALGSNVELLDMFDLVTEVFPSAE